MTYPTHNNGNGNGATIPSQSEQTELLGDEIGLLVDNLELFESRLSVIEQNIQPPAISLTDAQRTTLADIFVARYAIAGGIPVQAALEIAGFNVTVEQPVPPQPPQPGQDGQQQQQPPQQQQQQEPAQEEEPEEPDQATRMLLNIIERAEKMFKGANREEPEITEDTGADSNSDGDNAPGEEEASQELSVDDEADDTGTGTTNQEPASNPAKRHRTRGRTVRDEHSDASGAHVPSEPD